MKNKIFNLNGQIKSHEIKNMLFDVSIDTIDITTNECLLDEKTINAKSYMSKKIKFQNGKVYYCINPNYYINNKYKILSLNEFENIFNIILKELYINEYSITRIDIAIDSTISFEKNYKLNLYIAKLFNSYLKKSTICENIHDCDKTSIYCYNRDYKLKIYNKELESKGKDAAKTRFEFCFNRVRNNYTPLMLINKLLDILVLLPDFISTVTEKSIVNLENQYLLEQSKDYESKSLNLEIFVNKWIYSILNRNILNGIYKKHYMGELKNWLWRYKDKGYNITLYSNNDIILYIKQLKKALIKYKNVTKEATFYTDLTG